ncbi:RNA-binding protein NOB1 [Exaiptasia diaphana]|uniref:RNA-binding protein NOB1 n=1 Tax=Exaiptasia diaphana TaxID=2652724 RepID=A0A913XKQ8_EXADI|nr:RNA-binding protein NOB1 [Exaiptasia diaphana]KXJ11315.1 RNA-binding protein NOB1 [Exaiptasia diaphana]
MATNSKGDVKHLVVDSAGFIKNIELQSLGKRIYTLQEVVQEIKDITTRQRLAVLPYEITFKQPSTEAIKAVTDFSKLTGDFKVLSAVDLRVLALTYQLEKEFCGTDHLKTKPANVVKFSKGKTMNKIPGFYVEKAQTDTTAAQNDEEMSEARASTEDCNTDEDPVGDDSGKTLEEEIDEISDLPGCSISEYTHAMASSSSLQNSSRVQEPTQLQAIGDAEQMDVQEIDNRTDDPGDDEGFVEEDEDGWITPQNIQAIRDEMGDLGLDAVPADVEVGCLTTDFAMQNVLIQMGLHVVSVDGMLIREAKSYALKCYACFRVTHQMEKGFCPWCGNKTLSRVSISIDENGVTRYNVTSRKRPFNIRGKKYPLPLPQGGRSGENPVLVEDQPRGQRRLPPKRDKVDVMDPDFVARSSPFMSHDVNSRAVHLGFHVDGNYWNKRNPNEAKKNRGRRKKK